MRSQLRPAWFSTAAKLKTTADASKWMLGCVTCMITGIQPTEHTAADLAMHDEHLTDPCPLSKRVPAFVYAVFTTYGISKPRALLKSVSRSRAYLFGRPECIKPCEMHKCVALLLADWEAIGNAHESACTKGSMVGTGALVVGVQRADQEEFQFLHSKY